MIEDGREARRSLSVAWLQQWQASPMVDGAPDHQRPRTQVRAESKVTRSIQNFRAPRDAEPGRQRRDRQRENHARSKPVAHRCVNDRQQQEVPRPYRAKKVPLVLDVADVGGEQQRPEKQDVIVGQRCGARALPDCPPVAGRRCNGDGCRNRNRSDMLEILRDHDADAGGDEHHAAPDQESNLPVDADDLPAFVRDQARGGRGADHAIVAKMKDLRLERVHARLSIAKSSRAMAVVNTSQIGQLRGCSRGLQQRMSFPYDPFNRADVDFEVAAP